MEGSRDAVAQSEASHSAEPQASHDTEPQASHSTEPQGSRSSEPQAPHSTGQGVGQEASATLEEASPVWQPRYHNRDQVNELLGAWIAASGGAARWVDVSDGVKGIEFGGGDRVAAPLEKRRTVLLVGGLDGRSVAGGEAVLSVCSRLLGDLGALRSDLTIVAIPWAVPGRLQSVDQGQPALGRDLDGDGLVLDMLVEDPAGRWTMSKDRRFLVEARAGDSPRYRRLVEGQRLGAGGEELGAGGGAGGGVGARAGLGSAASGMDENGGGKGSAQSLDPEAAFPVIGAPALRGVPQPDGLVVYLQNLVLSRPMAAVVVFQGNHGGLATPGAGASSPWSELPDQATYERLGRVLAQATGRERVPVQTQFEARRAARVGSFVDWCYQVPGVLAMEIAPWGALGVDVPEVVRSDEPAAPDPWSMRPPMTARDRAWAHWLDDVRGGLGFVEWRPVERSDAPACLVGGWQPRTYFNPPEDALAEALVGLDSFVVQLLEHQPRLELCDVALERDGELCIVRARLRCQGNLPMRTQVYGRWPGLQAQDAPWLELELPASAQRLAGAARTPFASIDPGSKSPTLEWLVYAPAGTRLVLRFGWRQAVLGSKELTL
ncbi:MAG: hypothetical protein H6829_03615 [Planctomycetes bacterium]|nr:hypothetical protein [Planctomycetota bacterium]